MKVRKIFFEKRFLLCISLDITGRGFEMRWLRIWFLGLVLVSPSLGQTNSDIRPGLRENPDVFTQQQPEEKPTKGPPAGAIVAALASVALVLVLVCYPTRKN
jgi:hypothetical protein